MSLPEIAALPDAASWAVVLAGALTAGFITGFSGFGTALVASGFWYFALPAPMVPPLAAMAAVVGQSVGLIAVRAAFDWRRTLPFLGGGALGVPAGVALLAVASPEALRGVVGALLVAYSAWQLSGLARPVLADWGGRLADGAVGVVGGVLGGFAALSGPAPIVWLQLRGGPSAGQRAVYQPFNLIVLAMAAAAMAATGRIGGEVLIIAAVCVPLSLTGAWLGVRSYRRASDAVFRRVVLGLLLASGLALVAQTLLR